MSDSRLQERVAELGEENNRLREQLEQAERMGNEWGAESLYHLERAQTAETEAARLRDQLDALDRAAYYYRRELKEILADCDHDRPSIAKIRAHAETAIRAADHEIDAVGAALGVEGEADDAEDFRHDMGCPVVAGGDGFCTCDEDGEADDE